MRQAHRVEMRSSTPMYDRLGEEDLVTCPGLDHYVRIHGLNDRGYVVVSDLLRHLFNTLRNTTQNLHSSLESLAVERGKLE